MFFKGVNMEKDRCPHCKKEIQIENEKFVFHRRFIPTSEQDYEENVHCRNIVEEKCPGREINYVKIMDDKIFCEQCKEWQSFTLKEFKSKLISHKGQETFGEYTCVACGYYSTQKIGYH